MYRRRLAISLWLGLLVTCAVKAEGDYRSDLVRDGRILEMHISNQFSETSRQQLVEWMTNLADSLRSVYGHWPRRQWQVIISPASYSGSDPIPWADVRRGPIDSVNFYVSPSANAEDLKGAWTGYHELAHLLIPYKGSGDAWFSEGLASYYQNILQARSGVIDEQTMWQKLYDGYRRGLADERFRDRPLQEVSSAMRREGGFMRVYWSGAWYFLAADVRLRQQSRGRLSLDGALQKLNGCCADDSLPVTDIVSRLDELNRVILFQGLYDEMVVSREIPPYEPLFSSLGISIAEGQVRLQQQGPGVAIRRGIVTGSAL
jgi:hypothetical protein